MSSDGLGFSFLDASAASNRSRTAIVRPTSGCAPPNRARRASSARRRSESASAACPRPATTSARLTSAAAASGWSGPSRRPSPSATWRSRTPSRRRAGLARPPGPTAQPRPSSRGGPRPRTSRAWPRRPRAPTPPRPAGRSPAAGRRCCSAPGPVADARLGTSAGASCRRLAQEPLRRGVLALRGVDQAEVVDRDRQLVVAGIELAPAGSRKPRGAPNRPPRSGPASAGTRRDCSGPTRSPGRCRRSRPGRSPRPRAGAPRHRHSPPSHPGHTRG